MAELTDVSPNAGLGREGRDDRQVGRRRLWPALGAIGAVAGGATLMAIHASLYGHWLMDDAAITFAYSRNLADGYGPVLQPGASPVEGFSNPTWMVLLAVGKLLGLFDHGTLFGVPDYVLFPKGLALLCLIGMLTLFYFAAKVLISRPRLVTLVAGAALAAIPSFVIWCFSGLENSFYALSVVALAVLMVRAVAASLLLSARVAVGAGLLAALAALTRPDGLIYLLAFPLVATTFAKRSTIGASLRAGLLSGVAFLVPFGGYLIFRWFEFGRLVPNTAVAKNQPIPQFDDIAKAGEVIQYGGWLLVIVAAACLAVVMLRPSTARAGLIALLIPFGLAVVAFCVLQGDWMGQLRFATPIWALGALGGAVVVVEVLQRARIRGRLGVAVVLVVAVCASVSGFYGQGSSYRANVKTPLCVVAERDARTINGLADRLALPDTASVGVIDLGGAALVNRLRVIDLAGLGDHAIADYLGVDDLTGMRDYTFDVAKPDFINIIGTWDTTLGFSWDPRFARDYDLIYHAPSYSGTLLSYNYVGYWVRKDRVPSQQKLAELQAYAKAKVEPILALNAVAARRSCGPVLRPGQT